MCGIAGAVGLTPDARPDVERVRAMSCRIAHRGPDGEGVWVSPSGRAVLAHRRLSIIDIETGQQPMVDAESGGTRALVFNGEVYNYRELRDALRGQGAHFRTESDTEVLLRLVARDGAGAVDALRGMFAFIAWDDVRGELVVARDRVGKKPLFYVEDGGCLYFASSLRALRETAPAELTIDREALALYLALGYIPAPYTIYTRVRKLPAAHVATLAGGALRARRFWDLAPEDPPFEGTYEQALDALEERLGTAVEIRLRSDVPLGVFLSGGIDSSLIAALAARHAGAPVATFSIGFDDQAFDESPFAAEVARHLGAEHHLFRVHADVQQLLPQLVWHFGEPYADSSALPTWVLAEQTRRHVVVALGGDGGDEGFAG